MAALRLLHLVVLSTSRFSSYSYSARQSKCSPGLFGSPFRERRICACGSHRSALVDWCGMRSQQFFTRRMKQPIRQAILLSALLGCAGCTHLHEFHAPPEEPAQHFPQSEHAEAEEL